MRVLRQLLRLRRTVALVLWQPMLRRLRVLADRAWHRPRIQRKLRLRLETRSPLLLVLARLRPVPRVLLRVLLRHTLLRLRPVLAQVRMLVRRR